MRAECFVKVEGLHQQLDTDTMVNMRSHIDTEFLRKVEVEPAPVDACLVQLPNTQSVALWLKTEQGCLFSCGLITGKLGATIR